MKQLICIVIISFFLLNCTDEKNLKLKNENERLIRENNELQIKVAELQMAYRMLSDSLNIFKNGSVANSYGENKLNDENSQISIEEAKTKWDWIGDLGDRLLVPQLTLVIKNNSSKPIKSIYLKATFINEAKKEIFGEASTYVVSSFDTPLLPGFTKKAFLRSDTGYRSSMAAYTFPVLTAYVYLDDTLIRKIGVTTNY